jgi:hypothetical protein
VSKYSSLPRTFHCAFTLFNVETKTCEVLAGATYQRNNQRTRIPFFICRPKLNGPQDEPDTTREWQGHTVHSTLAPAHLTTTLNDGLAGLVSGTPVIELCTIYTNGASPPASPDFGVVYCEAYCGPPVFTDEDIRALEDTPKRFGSPHCWDKWDKVIVLKPMSTGHRKKGVLVRGEAVLPYVIDISNTPQGFQGATIESKHDHTMLVQVGKGEFLCAQVFVASTRVCDIKKQLAYVDFHIDCLNLNPRQPLYQMYKKRNQLEHVLKKSADQFIEAYGSQAAKDQYAQLAAAEETQDPPGNQTAPDRRGRRNRRQQPPLSYTTSAIGALLGIASRMHRATPTETGGQDHSIGIGVIHVAQTNTTALPHDATFSQRFLKTVLAQPAEQDRRSRLLRSHMPEHAREDVVQIFHGLFDKFQDDNDFTHNTLLTPWYFRTCKQCETEVFERPVRLPFHRVDLTQTRTHNNRTQTLVPPENLLQRILTRKKFRANASCPTCNAPESVNQEEQVEPGPLPPNFVVTLRGKTASTRSFIIGAGIWTIFDEKYTVEYVAYTDQNNVTTVHGLENGKWIDLHDTLKTIQWVELKARAEELPTVLVLSKGGHDPHEPDTTHDGTFRTGEHHRGAGTWNELGLENMGQTCYANMILNAHCNLYNLPDRLELFSTNDTKELVDLFQAMNDNTTVHQLLENFFREKVWAKFARHIQHDVSEFTR